MKYWPLATTGEERLRQIYDRGYEAGLNRFGYHSFKGAEAVSWLRGNYEARCHLARTAGRDLPPNPLGDNIVFLKRRT
jgi:hypothetical protein